ncbi:MAG TPA: type II CAAX endopeptidase family protein [Chloroflexaceae bacterium]|nr:type II CAAX endopeptidase family protein [Chloroflexaceae bacterium]
MDTAYDRGARRSPALYLGLLAVAELALAYGPGGLGVATLACLLLALQVHAAFSDDARLAGLLFALSLVPLARLLSLAAALPGLPTPAWQLAVGAVFALAALRGAGELRLGPGEIGLRPGAPLVQAGIALVGVPLGLLQYAILQPAPLADASGRPMLVGVALVALLGRAFGEELLFRGVLQRAAGRALGQAGLVFVAAVFAVLHLDFGSPLTILLAFGVGMAFGRLVERTGSLLGVTLASAIASALAHMVLPHAWQLEAGLPDVRRVLGLMAQTSLLTLSALLAGRWALALWWARREAAEERSRRVWAAEVGRLAGGPGDEALEAAARALAARLGPEQVLVVELDAARARTVVRICLGATGRRLRGPEGLDALWAAFARLIDSEALGPQQVGRHPFSLGDGPYLVMPFGAPGRWAIVRTRPGGEDAARRQLVALIQE